MVCHWAILEARSLMPLLSSDAPFFSRTEIQFQCARNPTSHQKQNESIVVHFRVKVCVYLQNKSASVRRMFSTKKTSSAVFAQNSQRAKPSTAARYCQHKSVPADILKSGLRFELLEEAANLPLIDSNSF